MGPEWTLKGSGGAAGIAHGPAVLLRQSHECPDRVAHGRPAEEWAAFESALEEAGKRIDALLAEATELARTGEAQASLGIFESHQALLADPLLLDLVRTDVFNTKVSAGFAVWNAVSRIRTVLERVKDSHIAEKTADLENVRGLLLESLGTAPAQHTGASLAGAVVVAPLLSPQDILRLVRAKVAAIVCELGTPNSHAAILARNFNLPAVLGVRGALHAAQPGISLVGQTEEPRVFLVDGSQCHVVCNPTPTTLRKSEARKAYWKMLGKELHERARLPAQTTDGAAIAVQANADSSLEVPAVRAAHADGVGLFRLESFYMAKSSLPTEDEVFAEISLLARAFPEKPITVRLLDAGADKAVPALEESFRAKGLLSDSEALANPMGLRGVRVLLRDKALLADQCRALVRANTHGNVRILVPFVTGIEEFREVQDVLNEVWGALARTPGGTQARLPVLGVMIETPAAACIASLLAAEVGFFSIGTNDLTQHTLAVDRTSTDVAPLYDPAHPALLRLLVQSVSAALDRGVPISLCGEMAADPLYVELLVGLGLRCLSCSPHAIPLVKEAVRGVSVAEAQRFVGELLVLKTVAEFKARLHERFTERFEASGGPGLARAQGRAS